MTSETEQSSTQPLTGPAARPQGRFRSLLVILLGRTALNTAFRIVYPFLPSLQEGLGISVTAASSLVTLRMVAGLAAPFLGPVADRHGRRRVMVMALGLFALASLLLAGLGSLPAAIIAFCLYGLSKILYDPTMHAYLGDTVPYEERGRAIGLVELAWSAAWLIGVPASGLLIERWGWRAPWAALVGLGVMGAVLTHTGLPAGPPPGQRSPESGPARRLPAVVLGAWRDLLRRPGVRRLLLVSLLLTAANEVSLIVYGTWLKTAFDLSLSSLGLASIVVGLSEAVAELGTTVLTDRLGKRRSVLFGLLGLAASLAALPLLAGLGLVAALAGVALMMLTFEFAIVSLIPLATEVAPDARASFLSLNMTAFMAGRIVAATAGGLLWDWTGAIAANAGAGAVCALLAALVVTRIKER